MVAGTQLPEELAYLIHLQSSFLSALSLHYAHHGASAPVDLREITPSVTRLLRKRQVTIDDVQLCLGLSKPKSNAAQPVPGFQMTDYGRGRVCIELDHMKAANGIMDRHIDEDLLLQTFGENLSQHLASWWKEQQSKDKVAAVETPAPVPETPRRRKRTSASANSTPSKRRKQNDAAIVTTSSDAAELPLIFTSEQTTAFVASLPRLPITPSPTIHALDPLKQRAKTLLATFKQSKPNSATASSKEKQAETSEGTKPPIPARPSASSRSSSLMDRLRAKQAMPKPAKPSAESTQRRAALSHALDVLDVLALLAAEKRRGQKGSGTAATLSIKEAIQRVKQSAQVPIGDDEIRRTLQLLSEETIAREWVTVQKLGAVEYVVMRTGGKGWRDNVVARVEKSRTECTA